MEKVAGQHFTKLTALLFDLRTTERGGYIAALYTVLQNTTPQLAYISPYCSFILYESIIIIVTSEYS